MCVCVCVCVWGGDQLLRPPQALEDLADQQRHRNPGSRLTAQKRRRPLGSADDGPRADGSIRRGEDGCAERAGRTTMKESFTNPAVKTFQKKKCTIIVLAGTRARTYSKDGTIETRR